MCRPCFKAASLIYDALLAVRVTPLYTRDHFSPKIRRNLTRKRTSSSSSSSKRRILWRCIDIFSGDAKILDYFPRKFRGSKRILEKFLFLGMCHPNFFLMQKFCLVGYNSTRREEFYEDVSIYFLETQKFWIIFRVQSGYLKNFYFWGCVIRIFS